MKQRAAELSAVTAEREQARPAQRGRYRVKWHPGLPWTWLLYSPPKPKGAACEGGDLCFCLDCLGSANGGFGIVQWNPRLIEERR